jgi:hypothetical protein
VAREAQTRRGSLTIRSDPTTRVAAPTGKPGRQRACSAAAIRTGLPMTVLLGRPLRQTTGFVKGLLRLIGPGLSGVSTLSRRENRAATGTADGATVTADGATGTRKGQGAIAARGAAATIPPRRRARPREPDPGGAAARNGISRTSGRVGRTLWRRWSGRHSRSRARTGRHRPRLQAPRPSARGIGRQAAEVRVRGAALTGCTAPGTHH